MSPQSGSRNTHTQLKWFMGTLVFIRLHCRDFSLFYFPFFFLRVYKKHKNRNKWISYFFPLRCFLSAFLIFVCLFVFCAFAWLHFCSLWCFLVLFGVFSAFWCFLCFWWVWNLFVKKKEEIKTALIASFILLLKFILLQAWTFLITIFFNYHNLFQLSQFFSIIAIFFNYNNFFQLWQFFFNYNNFFSIITIFLIITI